MKCALSALLVLPLVTSALADGIDIIGFDGQQGLQFQGSSVSNYYTLEFAPSPNGPWTNWGSVSSQPITGSVMSLPTPFFYRIKQVDPGQSGSYATGTPVYAESDPVYSVEKSRYATGTPVYVESDPAWTGASNSVWSAIGGKQAAGHYATGTPVYAESDPVWAAEKSGYATGTPLYAFTEGDPAWNAEKSQYVKVSDLYALLRQYALNPIKPPTNMALIPAGTFVMGDAMGDGSSDELPLHTVFVSAFYMDQYEVTKALWDEVTTWATTNGYNYELNLFGFGKATNHPVHSMNWYHAIAWCNARSEREGLTPCYTNVDGTVFKDTVDIPMGCNWSANGYRLPTEAEWEKAARGEVANQRFPWGDTITHSNANYFSSSSYAYDISSTRGDHPTFNDGVQPYTSPVGYFAPNGYGLYDMSGNVWEWCWDWYSSSFYSNSPPTDPQGPPSGDLNTKVRRGGGWYDPYGIGPRVAGRYADLPSYGETYVGFRCVRGGPVLP